MRYIASIAVIVCLLALSATASAQNVKTFNGKAGPYSARAV